MLMMKMMMMVKKEVREGKNPARVRNHGGDVPPPISAAWCAASA